MDTILLGWEKASRLFYKAAVILLFVEKMWLIALRCHKQRVAITQRLYLSEKTQKKEARAFLKIYSNESNWENMQRASTRWSAITTK